MKLRKLLFLSLLWFNCLGSSLDINYLISSSSPVTSQMASVIPNAVSFWESKLTGRTMDQYLPFYHIPNLTINFRGMDYGGTVLGNTVINDLTYLSFGTRVYAYSSYATITLNTTYYQSVPSTVLTQVIEHEIAHALGFGLLWGVDGLYVNGTGEYIGMNGVKAFQRESHQYSINYVPVELDFGTGTKDLHWDEEGFFNYELMEGRTSISRGAWVSSTTIASMRDLGYDTVELPTDNIPEPVSITIVSALLGVLVIYRRKTGSDRSSQCPF